MVFDTDVVIAGLRSPTGASAELLRMARRGELTLLISVPLFIEYDAKCLEKEHLDAAGLTTQDVQVFLDALTVIASCGGNGIRDGHQRSGESASNLQPATFWRRASSVRN